MNYYELLEVSQNASPEVIRAAYKSLMQRYHPDKNPVRGAMADRAARMAQAYEVLSAADKRALYDTQLRRQAQARSSVSGTAPRRSGPGATAPPSPSSTPYRRAAPAARSNWYLRLLAIVILASGAWLLLLSARKPAAPPQPEIASSPVLENSPLADRPESAGPAVAEAPKEPPAQPPRRIALLATDLNVLLLNADNSPDEAEGRQHVLSIPALTVELGLIETDRFAADLERQKETLLQKLSEKLAHAKYVELKIEGDRYLGKFIYDALRDLTGTRGLDDGSQAGPVEPNRFGVVAVALPSSFSLR